MPLGRGKAPLVRFGVHDQATLPSGRFDEALSGEVGVKPTPERVAEFTELMRSWIVMMNEHVPVIAAWGYSGRIAKVPADPVFANAWVDAIAKLGKRIDNIIGRDPDKLLKRAIKELKDKADKQRAQAILEVRKAAWKGTL